MKRIYSAFAFVFISLLAIHCQKEISNGIDGPEIPDFTNPAPAPVTATLQGNILDEAGKPAIGVVIKVGSKTATTNARGYFRIQDSELDKKSSLVTAEKQGYLKAYRVFSATSGVNQVEIKLIKKIAAGTVSAASGGNVTLANGASIALPAKGIIKASGGAYTGDVNVYAAYIDPTANDIASLVPGSFMADDKDNKRVILASYGMMAVELETGSGEKLQIANGSKAVLTTPIPSSLQSSAPASIKLWYVDEQTGIWKEEGMATKNGNNYVGDVKHFSYWNCDIPVPVVPFSAIIKTAEGTPIVHAHVSFRAATGYNGTSYGYTDSLGQVTGFIAANTNLILEILAPTPCTDVIYSQPVGPFSSTANLGTIAVNNSSSSLVTIKGKLLNCSNAPVTTGYAIINYGNYVRYAAVNSTGDFVLTFTTCSVAPASCEITGVDEAAQQQGTVVNVVITSPVTNAGTLTACGTSASQYVNYTLDGVNYSIAENTDSLIVYTTPQQPAGAFTHTTAVTGLRWMSHYIDFDFENNTTAGTYPLVSLVVENYNHTTLVSPFNIVMTSFPQAVGEFYEGNLTGQFSDGTDPAIHNISCSFRIRKTW